MRERSDEFILKVVGEGIEICFNQIKETINEIKKFSRIPKLTQMERAAEDRARKLQEAFILKIAKFLWKKEDSLKEPKYLLEQLTVLTSPEGVKSLFITDWPKEFELLKTGKVETETFFKKLELSGDTSSLESKELNHKILDSLFEKQLVIVEQAIEKCTQETSFVIACEESNKAKAQLSELLPLVTSMMCAGIDSFFQILHNQMLSGEWNDLSKLDFPVTDAQVEEKADLKITSSVEKPPNEAIARLYQEAVDNEVANPDSANLQYEMLSKQGIF